MSILCTIGEGIECNGGRLRVEEGVFILEGAKEGPVVFEHKPSQRVLCNGLEFGVSTWGGSSYTTWVPGSDQLKCGVVEGALEEVGERAYLVAAEPLEDRPVVEEYLLRVLRGVIGDKPVFITPPTGGRLGLLENVVESAGDPSTALVEKIKALLKERAPSSADCIAKAVETRFINPGVVSRVVKGEVRVECIQGGGVVFWF
uniref:Uncharacterized protein n=1 Tax=Thermogladius calderae TaxID=1200300 RepID=A0A7J3Y042_9CREN